MTHPPLPRMGLRPPLLLSTLPLSTLPLSTLLLSMVLLKSLVPSVGVAAETAVTSRQNPLKLESYTRWTSTLTTGLSPELACNAGASSSADASSALESACLQHILQESLRLELRIKPQLQLHVALQYGLAQGFDWPGSLLTTYGPRGNLKVLGMVLAWRAQRTPLEVKLGRFSRWDADPVLLDGVEATWQQRVSHSPQRLTVSVYGGAWAALDADLRAQVLYGALFSQAVPSSQGLLSEGPLEVDNDLPVVLGAALRWHWSGHGSVELADALYLDRHHLRLGAQWMPLPSLTLSGAVRSLNLRLRDVQLTLERVQALTGGTSSLQLRQTFEGEFPFSALSHGVSAVGSTRLLMGNPAPSLSLRFDQWRPLTPQLLGGLRLGLTSVEAAAEQAYQRSLLELGLQSHWRPVPRVGVSLEAVQVLAPQAGAFVDAGELVFNDGEGDEYQLNTFPNLSGEGEEAFLELASQGRVQLLPSLSASVGGGAVWMQQAYTAFYSLQDGVGGRLWLGAQWEPSPTLRAEARYLFEQDLNAGLYGWYASAHQASISLRARW